ncbi:MAG: hypothetical protein KDE55_10335 [Novosphingobium sp.]|nr:hypothetical protein [Novosphingobium sp.]MCB2078082.1 hypothetical protein [Novosphingobium sp.]MCP5400946.1 hypothetical protein [Novosphingobium sp.]
MPIDLTGGLPVDREYFYGEKPDPEVRDACNVWLEEENGAFGMRIGIEHVAEEWDTPELWLDIAFPDGRVISGREYGAGGSPYDAEGKPTIKRSGPLQYQCVEPFKHWKITFDPHAVRQLSARQLIDQAIPDAPPMREVAFEIDYFPAVPPLISGTLTSASREAMSGEQGTFISPRYEQLCRAKGWLSLDGERQDFSGQILRIKRQGVRKFEGFWGHCWMSALFPSGRGFGVNTFPPRGDGKPTFNEGFVFDGSGALKPARAVEIPWMEQLFESGEPVKLVLETEDGHETIEGTTFINCRSVTNNTVMPEKWPIVQQAHALYRWNGEEATGMIERSTLRDKMKL